MAQKANIKDICALVDLKANATDVFKVFDEIRRSVDIVSSKQSSFEQTKSFNELLNQQKVINHNFTSSGNVMSNMSETQRSASSTSHGGQYTIPQQIQTSTQAVFVWYGALTCGQLSLQTQQNSFGKYQFKESALEKSQSSFHLSSGSLKTSTLKSTAVPSAKTFGANQTTAKVEKQMRFIKWTQQEQNVPFAKVSQDAEADSGTITVTESGLYMIQFVQFTSQKKKPLIQMQIDQMPVLSTISDKS